MDTPHTPKPSALIIFGITGNLAHRKLLPALYDLAKHDLLPKPFRIIGVTRQGTDTEQLMQSIRDAVKAKGKTCDQQIIDNLARNIEIITMDLLVPEGYSRLKQRLDDIDRETGMCMNRLFYLAIPAQSFIPVIEQLGNSGLQHSCDHGHGKPRLLIEKPFGYDLDSAQALIDALSQHFHEEQLYRIDHYLAKETAQNILNFRFQNPIFKHIWNRNSVSHILISAAEQQGIEKRTAFYEQTGALRDIMQSHLLQLLSLVTMEEPDELSAHAIHAQKLRLLQAIDPIQPHQTTSHAIRGQYEGYRHETGNPNSRVETYAAVQLAIRNERWDNVPILLRTGKALTENVVDITLVFSGDSSHSKANILTIGIQPNEGISLQLLAKEPGLSNKVAPVQMDFCYRSSFPSDDGHPDAYERVLFDALRGDKTLFATSEEVLASWRILDNVVKAWATSDTDLHAYRQGTWGPHAAAELASAAGTDWHLAQGANICKPVSFPLPN